MSAKCEPDTNELLHMEHLTINYMNEQNELNTKHSIMAINIPEFYCLNRDEELANINTAHKITIYLFSQPAVIF